MAAGGRREEIDAKIKAWELDLERLRVALANATEATNARHHPQLVELCRRKESAKSWWEAMRGVYRPDAEAMRRCDEALAAMDMAWTEAHTMRMEILSGHAG